METVMVKRTIGSQVVLPVGNPFTLTVNSFYFHREHLIVGTGMVIDDFKLDDGLALKMVSAKKEFVLLSHFVDDDELKIVMLPLTNAEPVKGEIIANAMIVKEDAAWIRFSESFHGKRLIKSDAVGTMLRLDDGIAEIEKLKVV